MPVLPANAVPGTPLWDDWFKDVSRYQKEYDKAEGYQNDEAYLPDDTDDTDDDDYSYSDSDHEPIAKKRKRKSSSQEESKSQKGPSTQKGTKDKARRKMKDAGVKVGKMLEKDASQSSTNLLKRAGMSVFCLLIHFLFNSVTGVYPRPRVFELLYHIIHSFI
jgi:hypothetical protein